MNYRWSKSTKDNELLRTCDHFVTSSHPVTLPVTTHPIVIHQITPHRDEVTRFPVLSCPRARTLFVPARTNTLCARAPDHPSLVHGGFPAMFFPTPASPLPLLHRALSPHSPPPSPSPRHSTPSSPPLPLPLRPRPRIKLPLPSLAPPHFRPSPAPPCPAVQ